MYISAYIYGFFFIKDICELEPSPKETEEKEEKKNFFVDFFDYRHVHQTLKVAFKKGKKNRRKRICVILILVMVIIGPMYGKWTVFLYIDI